MLSNPNSTVWLTAVLTSVPTVQQHQRSSAALQESTQTLKGLCCCQVDLIQQDPVAFLHCLSQCSLQRNTPRIYSNKAQVVHSCTLIVLPKHQNRQSLFDNWLPGPPLTRALYLHKGEDHGCLTGSDLLLSLAQLDSQRLPPLLQQGS